MIKLKIFFLYVLLVITSLAGLIFAAVILIFVFAIFLPYLEDYESYTYAMRIIKADIILTDLLKNRFPTVINGLDLSRWIVGSGALFISLFMSFLSRNIKEGIYYHTTEMSILKADRKVKFRRGFSLKRTINSVFLNRKSELRRLQHILAKTKEKIDKLGKELSFLSVDVVNSTEMKKGEDPSAAEYYFNEYKNFVKEKLDKNRVVKTAWTPDGVMCCFESFDDAFKAAREIIEGLPDFNNKIQLFKNDFNVRCGINSGFVYFDNFLALEEMAGHTIDLAAHFQKNAQPNTVYAARESVPGDMQGTSFEIIEQIVDGCEMAVWRSRLSKS